MDTQKCKRCNTEQYIPTHQYVKYDNRVNYLCDDCWSVFRKWLNARALKEPKPEEGRLYTSGIVTGREPCGELETGMQPKKRIRLKDEVMATFKGWFQASTRVKSLEDKTE